MAKTTTAFSVLKRTSTTSPRKSRLQALAVAAARLIVDDPSTPTAVRIYAQEILDQVARRAKPRVRRQHKREPS
jgi:hypothetical protein